MGVETGRQVGLGITDNTSYSPHQLLLGDQLLAVFDQPAQDRKCLWSEGDHLAAAPEPPAAEFQAEGVERDASPSSHRAETTFQPQSHLRSIVKAYRAPYLRCVERNRNHRSTMQPGKTL